MYEQFFGFRERPFDLTPDPRYLVLTESHREALSNLAYGIASRKGITLLIGEAGSGKTTVIRTAIDRQPVRVHCVHLHNPTLSRAEFAEMLAFRYELSGPASQSKARMLVELETLLRARHDKGETSVLVVDEAHSLPLELLEEIRLLANIETNSEKLLSVVVAGQPELAGRLNQQALRQFKQRVALRCELRALSFAETREYIEGRIHAAGGVHAEIFTDDAIALVHTRAKGIPRTINVIADNALLGAFAVGWKPITSQVVREVCRDFDLTDPRDHADTSDQRDRTAPAVTSGAPATADRWPPVVAPDPDPDPEQRPAAATDAGSGQVPRTMFASYTPKRKRFLPFSRSRGDE